MELNISDDRRVTSPDEQTLRSAIAGLETDEFAILGRGGEEYVQTYHNADGTFDLEFRAGSCTEHYAAPRGSVSRSHIQDVFVGYAAGREDWKQGIAWAKLQFDADFAGDAAVEASAPWRTRLAVAGFALSFAGFLIIVPVFRLLVLQFLAVDFGMTPVEFWGVPFCLAGGACCLCGPKRGIGAVSSHFGLLFAVVGLLIATVLAIGFLSFDGGSV